MSEDAGDSTPFAPTGVLAALEEVVKHPDMTATICFPDHEGTAHMVKVGDGVHLRQCVDDEMYLCFTNMRDVNAYLTIQPGAESEVSDDDPVGFEAADLYLKLAASALEDTLEEDDEEGEYEDYEKYNDDIRALIQEIGILRDRIEEIVSRTEG